MNLFPRTPYARPPKMAVPTGPKLPKLSMGSTKLSMPKLSMPKTTQPKSPSTRSLKSFNVGNFMGPTKTQKATSAMFKSAQPKKMAIVKGAVAKLKFK